MALYDTWKGMAESLSTQQEYNAYWNEYFAAETENYKKILADTSKTYEGTVKDLAEEFGMTSVVFTGFIDGINTSLKTPIEVEKLEDDTAIKLDIDFEKLYFNMLEAKAKWLSGLKEWDGILSEEKRHEITKEWRASKQAVSEKVVGRNDPCPCGSGKKYKKCCGANL